MIQKLNYKFQIDVYDFAKTTNDRFQEFYVTIDRERKFLTDYSVLKKVLNTQEMYGLYDPELKGLLLIYREKGFRPYIKFLAKDNTTQGNLIKFLIWNFSNTDLYIKVKKTNSLSKFIQRYGFTFAGDRGEEILLFRKGEPTRKFIVGDKDHADSNR